MIPVHTIAFDSPAGPLTLCATESSLIAVSFSNGPDKKLRAWLDRHLDQWQEIGGPTPLLASARSQLEDYFHSERKEFDLPLLLHGSDFQQRVWQHLRTISYGSLSSYQSIAEALGSSARAVGGANGANPLAIVVPCHRVVAASGALQGYAGGTEVKEWLLRHEGAWDGIADESKSPRLFT